VLHRSVAPVVAGLLLGCSPARYSSEPGAPTLVFPGHFAEGTPSAPPSSAPFASAMPAASGAPAARASAAAPTPAQPRASNMPDPTPLTMAEQVEYELELEGGKIKAVSIKPVTLKKPIATARRLGRYAVELSIGSELIERVRFDFPGTAADEPVPGRKKLSAPLDLSSRAVTRVKLLLPHSPRVRRALLIDRALETVTELEWPLPAVPSAPVPSAAPPAPPPSAAPQP
jgi:hypothetical protein